jgi:ElaB/YqjD/DUF883 family membrane-anchored ribosome-binding protein
MNEIKPIELRIPTSQLKSLLEGQPEIALKLESMACEKIAEEILRKVERASFAEGVTNQVRSLVSAALSEAQKNLASTYRFPTEAKKAVQELAEDYVRAYFREEKKKYDERLNAELATKVQTLMDQAYASMQRGLERDVRDIAKKEFIAVLETARNIEKL